MRIPRDSTLIREVGVPSNSAIRREDAPGNLRDDIEHLVRTAIITGDLAPGTLVSVPSLAAQFAVSATPVREAMVNLQDRGFVEPVRNKGFRVTEVSPQQIRDVTQVRAWLEAPAMAEVAQNFPRERIGEFRALADRIVRCVDEGDVSGHLAADLDFHRAILELRGNAALVALVTDLRQQTRISTLTLVDTAEMREGASEHHRILDLLMDGDSAGVADLVSRHIMRMTG